MKIAIVGLGYWGPNLLRNFSNLDDCEIVAFDLDNARLSHFLKVYPKLQSVDSYQAILADSDIQGVVIATPVQSHHSLASQAMQAGKHVFVEKPLTQNVAEAEDLIRIAKETQRQLLVGHIYLFNSAVRQIGELINKGELGELLYIYSMRANLGPIRTDVDVLWDLAPHDLSIFRYWTDQQPRRVSATGMRFLPHDKCDGIFATYQYDNHLTAHCHCSWMTPKKIRHFMIVGTDKLLTWDEMNLQEPIRIYNKGVGAEHLRDMDFAQHIASLGDGDTLIPKIKSGEPLRMECQDFLDIIRGGENVISNGDCALEIVKALAATENSIRQGGSPVSIQ